MVVKNALKRFSPRVNDDFTRADTFKAFFKRMKRLKRRVSGAMVVKNASVRASSGGHGVVKNFEEGVVISAALGIALSFHPSHPNLKGFG